MPTDAYRPALRLGRELTGPDDSRVVRRLRASKRSLPVLTSYPGDDVVLVFADCDGVDDFADFATPKEADLACHGVGVGFRSAGGRYKRVVALHNPTRRKVTRALAWANLKHHLPDLVGDERFGVDPQGVLESFVDEAALAAVQELLQREPLPMEATEVAWEHRKLTRTQAARVRRRVRTKNAYGLAVRLLSAPGLLRGFDVPSTYWARQLGTSPARVRDALRLLVREGCLAEVSSQWSPGRRAMRYRATGVLAQEYRRGLRRQNVERSPQSPPGPGRWHDWVWRKSAEFSTRSLQDFLDLVTLLPGSTLKGRLAKAVRAWQYRSRTRHLCGGEDDDDDSILHACQGRSYRRRSRCGELPLR